jgi:serine/threonine protein kinase
MERLQCLSEVKNANFVSPTEICCDEALVHYVMPCFERLELDRGNSLPESRAVEIIRDVGTGLAALHHAGLTHRQLRPEKILQSRDGTICLGGCALMGRPRLSTATDNQPHYWSPEHCDSRPLDQRSDIYSLGATFFALLTGRPPYAEVTTTTGVLYAQSTYPPPDPRSVNSRISASSARVVKRAMARRPQDRYQSCQELLADLKS